MNKGAKRRMLLLLVVFILLVSYVSYTSFTYWKQILSNNKEKELLEDKYTSLLNEEEILETDLIKLQDPEYVAKYAREKYLYSKDGELIIKIIEDNE
ncbi:MAG: septum formation initiator family protein [Bacilli bacterium]|nr:septum formation initiator family protein [Bacilli bacterium]